MNSTQHLSMLALKDQLNLFKTIREVSFESTYCQSADLHGHEVYPGRSLRTAFKFVPICDGSHFIADDSWSAGS